jgi:cytochrome c553
LGSAPLFQLSFVNRGCWGLRIIAGMNPQAVLRLALASIVALSCAVAARAQSAATAAAAAAPAAPTATAPSPAASNPAAALPLWAQEKLAESRDPKVFDRYYKQGRKVADFCANCHGPDGQSVLPEVPNLAAQNTIYVLAQLVKFTEGKRKQFFMEGLMKALTQEEKMAVAVFYTNQPPKSIPAPDAALAARGKALYDKGCYKCHGANGYGNEKNARLAGQGPEYLSANMKRYKDGSASRPDENMTKAAKALTDDEVKALVAYIGSMK